MNGTFKGWLPGRDFGYIIPDDGSNDVFLHRTKLVANRDIRRGDRLVFDIVDGPRGPAADRARLEVVPSTKGAADNIEPVRSDLAELVEDVIYPKNKMQLPASVSEQSADAMMESEDIEELDTGVVDRALLQEIANWKREARAENGDRYFWHVREVDDIERGNKYYVIGRKGSGKTAISEYFNRLSQPDVFAEKLTFKNFPFNELYTRTNQQYTTPNQYITLWKYLIYSTTCRLMLKNEGVDPLIRRQLADLYGVELPLSRRVSEWVGNEFGLSLFGLSVTMSRQRRSAPENWIDYVDLLEDFVMQHAGNAKYFILFDELDEDYREIVQEEQYKQYTSLITSLFKAVQDVRSTLGEASNARVYPVIFLRDDIYELVQDADKNKWGDFRVDLNWDVQKIKQLMAFRITRALDPSSESPLSFEAAWTRVFGAKRIGVGSNRSRNKISTFDFIARSTLLRPRDFVAYLQACALHAQEQQVNISPDVVRRVDKQFSNYLKDELIDELFAILPEISDIFGTISQLRKWNFSIPEFERAYSAQVRQGFIKEENVRFVLQMLFLFSVIGNTPRTGWYVFRYQNREARLNFNERVVVHRGLFKALQII